MEQDIILTTDIQIFNGDFLVEESEIQHTEHIIKAETGSFYQYPEIGFGVSRLINASVSIKQVSKGISDALKLDNKKLNTIDFKNNNIRIDATRV